MKEKIWGLAKPVLFVAAVLVLWQVVVNLYAGEKDYDMEVWLDGKQLEAENTVYYRGGVMARLDWLAEVMEAEVTQDGKQYTMRLGEDELVLHLRSSEAELNGERYKLFNATVKEQGQIWVHARTVAEAFGWAVIYRNRVEIYTPEYLAREEREKPEIIFNGDDVSRQVGAEMLGGVCYARLDDLLKLLSSQPLAEYPFYAREGEDWQHSFTYFTTYEWQELAEVNVIVVWPNSTQLLIRRGDKLVESQLEHEIVYNPHMFSCTVPVYHAEELPELADGSTDWFTSDYFKGKTEIDGYDPLVVPAAEFTMLLLPGAETNFDPYTNTLSINCEGRY